MTALKQRDSECSLAAIATLNGLNQKDYIALSRLAREAGARYTRRLTEAIDIGLDICKGLGLYVPPDYPRKDLTGEPCPDFSGQGIVRIRYIRYRCRKLNHHVITFKDGVLFETNGTEYPDWDAFADHCKSLGIRDLTILKIFR